MGNATVHCDIGSLTQSGDENVHVAKRIRVRKPVDLPVLNDGNYYLHDDLQRFERFKQSMRDCTNNYQQVLLQIRAAYAHTYDMDTMQTIIDEVENMEDTERLVMMVGA